MNDATNAEHDITAILRLIWSARFYICVGIVTSLPIGISLMHVLPRAYRAEATIAPPAEEQNSGPLSRLGFSGLGLSSVGNNLSVQNGASFLNFLQVLSSHQLAKDLQQKYGLLQSIYRDKWDEDNKSWKPSGTIGQTSSFFKFLVTGLTKRQPDSYTLNSFLESHLSYSQIQTTPFYKISFTYNDRPASEKFLSQILQSADLSVRKAYLARAEQQIKYLERKLRETTLEQHKAALANLLINEERTMMLAQSSASFSFQLVSPISASPNPNSPRWIVVLGICAFLGGLVGLVAHLIGKRMGANGNLSSLATLSQDKIRAEQD